MVELSKRFVKVCLIQLYINWMIPLVIGSAAGSQLNVHDQFAEETRPDSAQTENDASGRFKRETIAGIEILESSGDESGDDLIELRSFDQESQENGAKGKVIVIMKDPEDDWITNMEKGFINIFSDGKETNISLLLCTFLILLLK